MDVEILEFISLSNFKLKCYMLPSFQQCHWRSLLDTNLISQQLMFAKYYWNRVLWSDGNEKWGNTHQQHDCCKKKKKLHIRKGPNIYSKILWLIVDPVDNFWAFLLQVIQQHLLRSVAEWILLSSRRLWSETWLPLPWDWDLAVVRALSKTMTNYHQNQHRNYCRNRKISFQ